MTELCSAVNYASFLIVPVPLTVLCGKPSSAWPWRIAQSGPVICSSLARQPDGAMESRSQDGGGWWGCGEPRGIDFTSRSHSYNLKDSICLRSLLTGSKLSYTGYCLHLAVTVPPQGPGGAGALCAGVQSKGLMLESPTTGGVLGRLLTSVAVFILEISNFGVPRGGGLHRRGGAHVSRPCHIKFTVHLNFARPRLDQYWATPKRRNPTRTQPAALRGDSQRKSRMRGIRP